jgi:hypothetical protein
VSQSASVASPIVGSVSSEPIPSELAGARTSYRTIYLLDLGVILPATVVGAVALLRGRDLGAGPSAR